MTARHVSRIAGWYGWADPVQMEPVGQRGRPDWDATIACYLLFAPWWHPLWSYYTLSAVHLRPIEGCRPPYLRTPYATHELMVLAVNPEHVPKEGLSAANYLAVSPGWLEPANVVEQFEGTTDDEIAELTDLCARAVVVHGDLNPEPSHREREGWRVSLWKTLEHIRHGGHPLPTDT